MSSIALRRLPAILVVDDELRSQEALRRTLEELYEDQRLLAEAVIRHAGAASAEADTSAPQRIVRDWLAANEVRTSAVLATVAELEAGGAWTFAKTILAAAEIRSLSVGG